MINYDKFDEYFRQYKKQYPDYPDRVLEEWAYDDCENDNVG